MLLVSNSTGACWWWWDRIWQNYSLIPFNSNNCYSLVFQYKNLAPRKKDRKSKAAAARNGQKVVNLAKLMKIVASPGRSILRVLTTDEVLVHFDRVLMRIFEKDPHYSMVINIYAFNFESIRHLRTLNNLSVSGCLFVYALRESSIAIILFCSDSGTRISSEIHFLLFG